MRGTPTRVVIALALLAAGFAGCGSGSGSDGSQSALTSTAAATTITDESSTTTSGTTPTTSSTEVPVTADNTGQSTTSLPGAEVEMFARPGDVLGVIGVAHDDVLNIRSGPGVGFEIIATLDPTDDTVATGRARQVPGAFWYQVEVDKEVGWVNMRFLAYLGGVDDATSQIVAEFDGEIPDAETMLDLGRVVADAYPRDEAVEPRITMIAPPTVGDLGEVTYDVIGLADDSLVGVRLHVFGQPTEGGEGFALRTVERTALCGRGLSGGLCV